LRTSSLILNDLCGDIQAVQDFRLQISILQDGVMANNKDAVTGFQRAGAAAADRKRLDRLLGAGLRFVRGVSEMKIAEKVKNGAILVSDGAWGTFLQERGLKPGECPELWCVEHRDVVMEIAKSYVDAGADMIKSNSFGGTRFKLEHFGLAGNVAEINQAAAAISRKAAGPDRHVIASVGATGKLLLMGDVTEQELHDAFQEQMVALEQGGADACCIETMAALDEAVIAAKAAKESTGLEVICTLTFERTVRGDYRTMMGTSPLDVVQPLREAGADIIGANCGNGMERMVDIVAEMRGLTDAPILVHANAGSPQNINGVDVFPETPAMMAAQVPRLLDAGANVVGGCCGTTPEHIRAIVAAVRQRQTNG